ncbi:MAG: hypothetical protein ABII01_01870 [Candidatus Woesearchaeota archaeon]
MKGMKGKKGVTPLLATIIVVFISIVIGGLVMTSNFNFVKNVKVETDEFQGRLTCSEDIEIEVRSACWYSIDENIGMIKLMIENKRSVNINGNVFWLRVKQGSTYNYQYFDGMFNAAEIRMDEVPFNWEYGEPNTLSVIPIIKRGTKDYLCTESANDFILGECSEED